MRVAETARPGLADPFQCRPIRHGPRGSGRRAGSRATHNCQSRVGSVAHCVLPVSRPLPRRLSRPPDRSESAQQAGRFGGGAPSSSDRITAQAHDRRDSTHLFPKATATGSARPGLHPLDRATGARHSSRQAIQQQDSAGSSRLEPFLSASRLGREEVVRSHAFDSRGLPHRSKRQNGWASNVVMFLAAVGGEVGCGGDASVSARGGESVGEPFDVAAPLGPLLERLEPA